eukprot:8117-Heterococcus_DN1.PRE.2
MHQCSVCCGEAISENWQQCAIKMSECESVFTPQRHKSCHEHALPADVADDMQCSKSCRAHGRQLCKPVERRRTFQLRRRQEMKRFMSAVLHKSNSNTHWQSIRNGVLSSAARNGIWRENKL